MKKIINILLYLLIFTISSCAPGTDTGNPIRVNMEFSTYNNSIAKLISEWFIKSAHASPLSDFKMCFKRVRFKVEDSSLGKDIDLELGEVLIKEEGTPLGNISIINGIYKRVEFDLAKDCDGSTKPSVSITNGNGTFTSDDSITIRFEGQFEANNGDLELFIQNIVDQVKNYQLSDGGLKDQLESVSGTF